MRPATMHLLAGLCTLSMTVSEHGGLTPAAASTQTRFLEITVPTTACGLSPAIRPPIHAYTWQTAPGGQDPADVRWILIPVDGYGGSYVAALDYIRNNPSAPEWGAWQPYMPPSMSWVTPPVDYGDYVFAVQGRDGQGTAGDEFTFLGNARRIRVGSRLGPWLTVTGDHIPTLTSRWPDYPGTTIGLSGGTEVTFCWTGNADSYCGIVNYRYGWDIADVNDPSQWEIDYTPFASDTVCSPPKTFHFGTHTFHVELIDNDGYISRVPISIVYSPLGVERRTWGQLKGEYNPK